MIELKDVTKDRAGRIRVHRRGQWVRKIYFDQVDHERIGPDIRHDHREWTESEPYEAQTYSEVQKRAWSCVPGLQTFKRQKYL